MRSTLFPKFVMAGHVKTRYIDLGVEAPIVIGLHGGGPGVSGQSVMGPIAQCLQKDCRFLAPDQVGGFGFTDPGAPTPYGSQSRVDHLADFADTLCLDKVHLVGNSQGAWVAARYAIQRPDRVKSLILIASGTVGKSMGLEVPVLPGLAALQAFDGTREAMHRISLALVHNKATVSDEQIDERFASATRPGAAEAMRRFAIGQSYLEQDTAMRGNFDMRETLPALTKSIPTLVLWGESDQVASIEVGRQLEKLLPNVRFVYIPDVGHHMHVEKPDLVAQYIREHMAA